MDSLRSASWFMLRESLSPDASLYSNSGVSTTSEVPTFRAARESCLDSTGGKPSACTLKLPVCCRAPSATTMQFSTRKQQRCLRDVLQALSKECLKRVFSKIKEPEIPLSGQPLMLLYRHQNYPSAKHQLEEIEARNRGRPVSKQTVAFPYERKNP